MEAIKEFDYNTNRPDMVIPEYGRNVQKMVEHAMSVEDRTERNKIAHAIISVMGQLQPHLRDIADFKHKLWDHLFVISDFKLDVDSPYPIPEREILFEKPESMDYPKTENRYKHYGKSVKNLIDAAIAIDDKVEQSALVGVILNLMKKNYIMFNQESVDDHLIISDLKAISLDQLEAPKDFQITSTNEVLAITKKKSPTANNNQKNQKNHKNTNQKQNSYKKRRY